MLLISAVTFTAKFLWNRARYAGVWTIIDHPYNVSENGGDHDFSRLIRQSPKQQKSVSARHVSMGAVIDAEQAAGSMMIHI